MSERPQSVAIELVGEKEKSGGSFSTDRAVAERVARRIGCEVFLGPNSSCFRTSRKMESASAGDVRVNNAQ